MHASIPKKFDMKTWSVVLTSCFLATVCIDVARADPAASCTDKVATLNKAATAAVKGSDKVVALLDCPATKGGSADTVVAIFANSQANTPLCSSQIGLMDGSGNFYLGKIKSVEVRTLQDKSLVVVPLLAGGEPNHAWTSQAFIRLDDKCGLTQLAKIYSRVQYDEDDSSKCEGTRHVYKFLNESTVEIRRDQIHCTAAEEKVETTTKTFDLETLLRNPKLRIVEP
jgi:hypothetical protein